MTAIQHESAKPRPWGVNEVLEVLDGWLDRPASPGCSGSILCAIEG